MKIRYSLSERINSIWILLVIGAVFIIFLNSKLEILSYIWLPLVLIWTVRTFYIFISPEISYSNGQIRFKPFENLLYRVSIPIKDIVEIQECKREIGGTTKMIKVPTFKLQCSDGNNYELFPVRKDDNQVDKIRKLLNNSTGINIKLDSYTIKHSRSKFEILFFLGFIVLIILLVLLWISYIK